MGVPASDTRFLRKLYLILVKEDPAIVRWDAEGTSFSIFDTAVFQKLIKSKYHLSSLCTFRQNLQAHGFTEIEHRTSTAAAAAGPEEKEIGEEEEGGDGIGSAGEDGTSTVAAPVPETYYHEYFVKGHPEYLEKIPFDPSMKFRCQECKRQPNEAGTKCSFRRNIATATSIPDLRNPGGSDGGSDVVVAETAPRIKGDTPAAEESRNAGRTGDQGSLVVRVGANNGSKSTSQPSSGSLAVRLPFGRADGEARRSAVANTTRQITIRSIAASVTAASRKMPSPPRNVLPHQTPASVATKSTPGATAIQPSLAPLSAQIFLVRGAPNVASQKTVASTRRASSPVPGKLQSKIAPSQAHRSTLAPFPVQIPRSSSRSSDASTDFRASDMFLLPSSASHQGFDASSQGPRGKRIPSSKTIQSVHQVGHPGSQSAYDPIRPRYPAGAARTPTLQPSRPTRTDDAGFVGLLWGILANEDPSVICWNKGGASFSIHDTATFEQVVRSKYQLTNMCTFRHYLRAHGFKEMIEIQLGDQDGKKDAETYCHDLFMAAHPEKLDSITYDDSVKLFLCHECRKQPHAHGSQCSARQRTVVSSGSEISAAWARPTHPPTVMNQPADSVVHQARQTAARGRFASSRELQLSQSPVHLQSVANHDRYGEDAVSAQRNSLIVSRSHVAQSQTMVNIARHAVPAQVNQESSDGRASAYRKASSSFPAQHSRAVSGDRFSGDHSSGTADSSASVASEVAARPMRQPHPVYPPQYGYQDSSHSMNREFTTGEYPEKGNVIEHSLERNRNARGAATASASPGAATGFAREQHRLPASTPAAQLSTRLATKTTAGLTVMPSFQAPMSVTLSIGGRKRAKQIVNGFGLEQQTDQKRMRVEQSQARAMDRVPARPLMPQRVENGEWSQQAMRKSETVGRVTAPSHQRVHSEKPMLGGVSEAWSHAGRPPDGTRHPQPVNVSSTYPRPHKRLPSMLSAGQSSSFLTTSHCASGEGMNSDVADQCNRFAGRPTSRGLPSPLDASARRPTAPVVPAIRSGPSRSTRDVRGSPSPDNRNDEDGLSLLMLASADSVHR